LLAPPGLETRPTADRMKEDLFNILGSLVKGAVFLDLFCGSGAIGIEALSRGANSAVFVDSSPKAVAATEANLQKTRLRENANVLHAPVEQALNFDQNFDIIFADPPYESNALICLDLESFLTDSGLVVVECSSTNTPELKNLTIYRQKRYTQTQFVFYERQVAFK